MNNGFFISPRLTIAYHRIHWMLRDGEWHPWEEIVNPVAEFTDLLPKTIGNILYEMSRYGEVLRRGRRHRFVRCHQQKMFTVPPRHSGGTVKWHSGADHCATPGAPSEQYPGWHSQGVRLATPAGAVAGAVDGTVARSI